VLERRAALVRERIEQRLEVLERRRDGLVQRVQSLTRPSLAVAAVLAVGVFGILLVQRARRRRQARFDWLARREPEPGWFSRAFEKAAVSLGAAALHRLGAWGVHSAMSRAPSAPSLPPAPPLSAPRLPRM
jgi:hypothetical protein